MDLSFLNGLIKQKYIRNYSLKDIKDMGQISLKFPLSDDEINFLVNYLCSPIKVIFNSSNDIMKDENIYFNDLKNIFNKLGLSKKNYNIEININNRYLFNQSFLLDQIPKNINLFVNVSDNIYSLDEYLQEEVLIENMIAPIKKANLSPLEKFLAIYDIVKNFKPYNNGIDSNDKNIINKVLIKDNKYIACGGFSKLLADFLSRVEIPCKCIFVNVDVSNNQSFTGDKNKLKNELHMRNLIKLDDSKYNIHGFYLSDSTWDNNSKFNLYLNSLITFDRKKEARDLEELSDVDLLMDFHDIKEFNDKISFFIKRITSKENNYSKKQAIKLIYLKIIDLLSTTDYNECKKIYDKYNHLINIDISMVNDDKLELYIRNLLVEYARYIIPLVNKKIDNKAMISALIAVQKNVYSKSDSEINDWIADVLDANKRFSQKRFPYIYDYHDKREGYLSSRHK